MVEVACLGVLVVRADDVAHADFLGELLETVPPAVIADVHVQLVAWPVQAQRREHRGAHDREIFVIGRDEEVDRRPAAAVSRQRGGFAIQRPAGLYVAEDQDDPGVGLRHQQGDAARQVEIGIPMQRGGVAPPQVAAGNDGRQHDQHQHREAPGNAPDQQGQAPEQEHEGDLRGIAERFGDTENAKQYGQRADGDVERVADGSR